MTMMKLTPNLVVDDVLETTRFWCDVFGFEFVVGVAEGTEDSVFELTGRPLGFAMLKADNTEVMLQSPSSLEADIPGIEPVSDKSGAMLFIEVDDVAVLREQIGDRADLVNDLRDTFYGMREFAVRDPAGMVVIFAERLGKVD